MFLDVEDPWIRHKKGGSWDEFQKPPADTARGPGESAGG
jgi:hypothetical protein